MVHDRACAHAHRDDVLHYGDDDHVLLHGDDGHHRGHDDAYYHNCKSHAPNSFIKII